MLNKTDNAGRRLLSLLSGTSADGVDVGLVFVSEPADPETGNLGKSDPRVGLELEWFQTFDYDRTLRRRIHGAPSADLEEIARLHARLGDVFADAAIAGLLEAEKRGLSVDAVASHGQTVLHLPKEDDRGPAASVQLGDGDRIAERTGKTTVCEFRQRDLAAGGQGAPLTPFLDHVLWGEPGRVRVAANLGGILNISVLTGVLEQTLAFDVGPANSVLDLLAEWATEGRELVDRDGRLSREGTADPDLVAWFGSEAYFDRPPPKSTGRELFGVEFVRGLVSQAESRGIGSADLLATAVEGVGESLARGIDRFVEPRFGTPSEVIVSGGGVHNPSLLASLRRALDPISVVDSSKYGVSVDGKEVLLFALLAYETLEGRPSNVPSATGASRRVPLGKICSPRR